MQKAGVLNKTEFFSNLDFAIQENNQIGFIMETDMMLEKLLKDSLVTKKSINHLKRNKSQPKIELIREKTNKRPLWRLLTDAYIYNILNREQIKRINSLRKRCGNLIKKFDTLDSMPELKKSFYNEWTSIFRFLIKKNNELIKELRAKIAKKVI